MSTLKVQGHPGLVRDLKTQAIVNVDSDAYAKYMARKKKQQAKDDAAFKKKVAESQKNKGKGTGVRLGGEFQGPRKNVLKRMNMGGVMKGRGGTFKGVY